ncbi:hypothetical protein TL18_02525 [Methanobrevibacter sp. YE315]|uniref:MATE family efflux transporter n=1 Tax=Methanobrevibacter sp. YE315 TaxID=1609968 RepID=UPI000764F180|nr:MATE family efflux transporter [Methanobrevibacter sp. YE315]AMD16995.1 hypothetical protein TL18_02525 [Methanobrevibacter sp. YE315]
MNEKIDLVSLPKKSFWKLSVPIIAFCIFDALYGIVDMVWISKISIEATFAIGVSIPITSLIFSFGDSIGQGTNSIMSRFIGSGDYESSYNALIHGMIFANIIWVVVLACMVFANGILYYWDQADSYVMVFDYLVPIAVFAYIFIFNNLFCETLQAEGNSHLPTILMISANILNLILDPIFIFNLNLGIKGAAYATVLSAFVVFIIFIFWYISGRTKIPLSLKYFKIRRYIFVEIFKVALPNFLDNGLWCFSASFINSILFMTMGEMGPVLYALSNKLKSLLIAPVRGYGRGLMSVTGHLFGAHEFKDLEYMFKYVLKISFITILIVMIVFIFVSNYVFSLFSVTGMENEVFWIAIGGTVIMLAIPFSMISSKMLDGFGKSMYSLLFTCIKIIFELILIYALSIYLNNASCVLIGILVAEILAAIAYYLFLRHLFKNFEDTYSEKSTVKTFNDEENLIDAEQETKDDNHKISSKIPSIIALIALESIVLGIAYILIKYQSHELLLSGLIAFVIGTISYYLMERLNKPILSVIGFLVNAVLIFFLLGNNGYMATILLIIVGAILLYMKLIFKRIE